MAGRRGERRDLPMPYTPEQMGAYLESLKELRENIALGRTPPSIWDLPIPAEGELSPGPTTSAGSTE
jgi:hypothetical protein